MTKDDVKKLVELTFDESDPNGSGIMAISVVTKPAIKEGFVALSEQTKVEFKTADEEKRLLVGPALIPDLPIYRKDEKTGEEFYAFMKADTIESLSHHYFRKMRQKNATIEHMVDLDGLCVVETWLIEDPEKDKSAAMGLSYPKGTWMIAMSVDREDIWSDFIKTGKLTGFSIEGFLNSVVVNQSEDGDIWTDKHEKRLDAAVDVFEKIFRAHG